MNLVRSVLYLSILILISSCGLRTIPKKPVPRQDEILSIRLIAEGDRLLSEGKDHLAMLKYLEAAEANPYYEVIFNKLAIAYLKLGLAGPAQKSIDRALGLNREYAFAHHTQGLLHLRQGDRNAAEDSFHRAISLKEDVAVFHVNLGNVLVRQGKTEEALREFERARKLDPNVFRASSYIQMQYENVANTAEDYFRFARVHARLGNLERVIDYLGRAFARGFDDFDRLLADSDFAPYLENERFRRFLRIHGADL